MKNDSDLHKDVTYFIYSWNQAIKGGLEPNYNIWRQLEKSSYNNMSNKVFSWAMIGLTWVIRLSNDFLMRIVLLSFLIALVGKSLTKSNDNWALNRYKIQAEMNLLPNV